MDKSFHEQIIIVPAYFMNFDGESVRLDSKEELLYTELQKSEPKWRSVAYEILQKTGLKLPVYESLKEKGVIVENGVRAKSFECVGRRIVQRT